MLWQSVLVLGGGTPFGLTEAEDQDSEDQDSDGEENRQESQGSGYSEEASVA